MRRIFLDTEFTNLPWTERSELLWIGLADEHGNSWSAINTDVSIDEYTSEFTQTVVAPRMTAGEPRLAQAELAVAIREFCGTPLEFWAWCPTVDDLAGSFDLFIERQWGRADNGEGLSLAVHSHEHGRAVGLVAMGLRPQPGVIGLGYRLVPSARGMGLATEAATLAGDWAVGVAGFARIEAWVEPDNVASQAVLRAAGFEAEGRLRAFLTVGDDRSDALVYSRVAP